MLMRLRSFIRTTVIGGVVVILPVAVVGYFFRWIFRKITDIIQPLSEMVTSKSQLADFVADILVITAMVAVCFLVGLVVRTRLGRFLHGTVEEKVLKAFPGYSLVKETVLQFLGNKKSPFSTVAMVQLFDSDTLATGFITDAHDDGSYTVFVPTGPNPTSGQIFHLKAERVHIVEVPVEETMRSIISCGAGSSKLVEAYHETRREELAHPERQHEKVRLPEKCGPDTGRAE